MLCEAFNTYLCKTEKKKKKKENAEKSLEFYFLALLSTSSGQVLWSSLNSHFYSKQFTGKAQADYTGYPCVKLQL